MKLRVEKPSSLTLCEEHLHSTRNFVCHRPLVAADGQVTSAELMAIRRLYAALAIDRAGLDATLGVIGRSTSSEEPITVLPAISGNQGEAIPRPAPEVHSLVLDRVAIAAILRDTEDVSRMLAEAMNAEEVDDRDTSNAHASVALTADSGHSVSAVGAASDPSIPARYAAFFQAIIVRDKWARTDLVALAKHHDLMLAGAVEAINDWSNEKYGGPIIYEDDQQFTIESAYLN